MNEAAREFLREEVVRRFLNYVKIDTASSETSGKQPSTPGQWNLAKILEAELRELGLSDVFLCPSCYVYGTLPASEGSTAPPLSFISHMDTSPSESGKEVVPVLHENYDGSPILFKDNPSLTLTPMDSPELEAFIGDTVITASGGTLLGADNKAGIAEIISTLSLFKNFPEFRHPELRIVFTPDEEIGRGVDKISMKRLGRHAYTVDGSGIGEYEVECFDAYGVTLDFKGINVHPGYAKKKMVNAAAVAARFIAALPESQSPENTDNRDGFFHVTRVSGNENTASVSMIIRDFEKNANLDRLDLLDLQKKIFEKRYPGLSIRVDIKDQYNNMKEVLDHHPEVVERVETAMEMAGIHPRKKAIRGGTDGARLSFMGVPTPNIFTGGMMFHSKKEWISRSAMEKSCRVLVNLCSLYA